MYKFTRLHPPFEDQKWRQEMDATNVEISIDADDASLSDLCLEFKHFLLACGFSFEGEIEIVNEEEVK